MPLGYHQMVEEKHCWGTAGRASLVGWMEQSSPGGSVKVQQGQIASLSLSPHGETAAGASG